MKNINIKFNSIFFYIVILFKILLINPSSSFSKTFSEDESNTTDLKSEILLSKTNNIFINKKDDFSGKNYLFKLANNFQTFITYLPNNLNKINIESDFQSQENNVFKAEGNVSIDLDGKQLRADKFIYNKTDGELTLIGNILFIKGDQYFEATKIYYDFNEDIGYIENIYGQIDTKTFNLDLGIEINSNEENILDKEISNLKTVENDSFGIVNDNSSIKNFDLSIPEINKWRFKSKKVIIKPNLLESKRIFFTNDAYNEPQFFVESYNFLGNYDDEEIKFTSKNTWINFDNKLKLPIGKSSFINGKDFVSRWGFGYDMDEKDGFFIRRGFDTKNLFGDFTLDINSYFLVQRSIKGDTKGFHHQGKEISGNEITYQNDLTDLIGIDTKLKGKIKDWEIDFKSSNNSIDPNKLRESSRLKINLKKSIDLNQNNKDINLNQDFYESSFLNFILSSSYREKISKGFSGEEEIYWGNSFSVENKNSKLFKNSNLNYSLLYELGNFNAKSRDKEELNNLSRNLLLGELSHDIYLWRKKGLMKSISKDYKYSPKVISEGLIWKNILKSGLFLYSNDQSQKIISFSAGPELTTGSLRSKFFDFTKFSSIATYTLKEDKSPFAFDDVNDSFRVKFNLEQQLYGPLVLSLESYLNLNNKDKDYGSFKESVFGLDFKRRAYNVGFFYKPTTKSIGIKFNIFNFDYSGFAPSFRKK